MVSCTVMALLQICYLCQVFDQNEREPRRVESRSGCVGKLGSPHFHFLRAHMCERCQQHPASNYRLKQEPVQAAQGQIVGHISISVSTCRTI